MVPDELRLWDDNPTDVDMLGFGPVVDAVVSAVSSPHLDPVTVALQSSWGGGKSSALQLVESRLRTNAKFIVVRCDPWEYDDLPKSDVRALLIGQVLAAFAEKPTLFEQAKGLIRRIAWVKVGATIANMALARTIDAEKLVDVFTPEAEEPTSMAGFRTEFEKIMRETDEVEKVIVLVDDLDRCSPDSVVAILEAIKVFLSVPKMGFVLAAEEGLIRYAIERSENSGARSTYSDRYLEKIVQLPVRLPTLSREDAETFILLLLAERRINDPEANRALVAHVAERRAVGKKPYVGAPYGVDVPQPDSEDLALAAQIARGLSVDRWSSPRAIKRFLNAWGVRMAIANARGTNLDLDVMLKLYILEDRHPDSFAVLVGAVPEERGQLLDAWEQWAKVVVADDGHDELPQIPEGIEEETRAWAAADPGLAGVAGKIDTYLNVAATFTSTSAGEGLSTEVLALMDDLVHATKPFRDTAIDRVKQLPVEEKIGVVRRLLERAGSIDADLAVDSAAQISTGEPSVAAAFHIGVTTHALRHISPSAVVDIASVEGAEQTLTTIVKTKELEGDVRSLAEEELKTLQTGA